MKEYKKLPELDILPVKPQKEIDKLRDDLMEYGYDPQNPIVIWKNHDIIVDGNHRYDICHKEGIEPSFLEKEFITIDEVKIYILKHYLQCEGRVKTPTQEATALLELKELVSKISQDAKERKIATQIQPGRVLPSEATAQGREPQKTGEATEVLAEIAGTGKKTIERVLRVQKQGVPELNEMMKNGELSAKAAEVFVKNIPKYEQEKIVKDGGADAVKSTVVKIREVDKNAKKFDEFNDPLKEKNKRDIEEMRQVKELASTACLLPNLLEKYCETCKWGFDVYIPSPHETEYCPYCGGKNIVNRKPNWNSRLAAIKNE
jgi:ParB-like chromosome segregation protein Spo0J